MINSIWIKSFRCLSELQFNFIDYSLLPIIARNNSGKTSILEACFILGNLKSFVTNQISQVVPFSKEASYMGIKVEGVKRSDNYYLKIDSIGKKYINLNHRSVQNKSEIMSLFRSYYISSDSLLLITSSPSFRRSQLDQFISQFSTSYRHNLGQYKRLIAQKNQMLKMSSDFKLFEQLNKQIAPLIVEIRKERLFYLKQLEVFVNNYFNNTQVFDGLVSLEYFSNTLDFNTESELFERMCMNIKKEKIIKTTPFGTHRDDFSLKIDGKFLHQYYSRGVCRFVAYFLHLGMVEIIKQKTQLPILLLLDEPFSEIHFDIKDNLISSIPSDYHVIYTTTQSDEIASLKNQPIYGIKDGVLCKT